MEQKNNPDPTNAEIRERDPENRPAPDEQSRRDKHLDKTLADSYPASDPPSTIPDPSEDEEAA